MSAWDKLTSRAGVPGKRKSHWSFDEERHKRQVKRNKEKWNQPTDEQVSNRASAIADKYIAMGVDLADILGE